MLFAADLPPTARFVISDARAIVAETTTNDVTIALGGTVRFEYPSGAGKHNVNLERSGPDCAQVAGATTGARGRILPPDTEGPGWVVQCTFPVPGVYHFGSDENGAVHGVVRVANADGSVPTENPPAPQPTPQTYVPGAPGTPNDPATKVAAGRPTALKWTAAKRQRKTLRVVLTGGSERTRLTVEARMKQARVGRVARTVAAGARVTVKVPLNRKAKAALKRRKSLALTVRVVVAGKATTAKVTLRR